MNDLTIEWIAKAEGDYASAGREYRALILLERYAVQYRYPGETADKSDAQLAFQAGKAVRAFMRSKFGMA